MYWFNDTEDVHVCIGRCRVADASPTVARRTLARWLRQRREGARITAAKAADHAGMHAGTLSRIESGVTRVQPGSAQLLMKFYGASEEECEAAFQLAHTARRRGWWRSYKSIPDWFEPYVGLETEASVIRGHQVEAIPALFQTEEYALALEGVAGASSSEEGAREHAALLKARQERVTAKNPPELSVVLSEAALHREIGGVEVMEAQLRRLRECCDLPNVACRVLPFTAGANPAAFGSFTVFSFPDSGLDPITYGDVAYVEYGLGALYFEDPAEVAYYTQVFDALSEKALDPQASAALVERALAKYS
ncbi:helix-turn-helix transcriptional regulator [Nocardiopsis algeriensis]|uniref:Transcriptional regulator with XRE-family HTH domain n=1 Tax=Nocardiopsis algeriensis TaxID=1478215 RepID=A0A841IWW8_9ACTN|nr:transcriptional regulator with XRE-family HTH domain [Nocardiopsis algeriensis]